VRRIEELLVAVNRSTGATMILTSHHNDSTLRIGDQLVLLADKRGVSGPPRTLVASGDPRVEEFFADVIERTAS
jgi:ABC-type transporter Mla maintaining outer membrane lipid asymmetry ATPase subunit MlaF